MFVRARADNARMRLLPRHLQRLRGERGQALVEFALIAPLFLMLVIGVIQFAVALNFWFDLQRLANQGARSAAVNCGPVAANQCGNTTLVKYLSARTPSNPDGQVVSAGNTPSVEICYIPPSDPVPTDPPYTTAGAGDSVRVTLKDRYRLQWIVNLASINLTARATMRLEQTPNGDTPSTGPLPDPTNSTNWVLKAHTGSAPCQP